MRHAQLVYLLLGMATSVVIAARIAWVMARSRYANKPQGWTRVSLYAPPGTECGVVEHQPGKLLVINARRPGEDWPGGAVPKTGRNQLTADAERFTVVDDGKD